MTAVANGTKATLKSLTDEQKAIKRLQKELKEAQLEHDILKKAVGIFSKGYGVYSDLYMNTEKYFRLRRCVVFLK